MRKLLPLGEGCFLPSPVAIRSRMMRHDVSRSLEMPNLGRNTSQSCKKLCSVTQRFDETLLVQEKNIYSNTPVIFFFSFFNFYRHFFLHHGQPQTRKLWGLQNILSVVSQILPQCWTIHHPQCKMAHCLQLVLETALLFFMNWENLR